MFSHLQKVAACLGLLVAMAVVAHADGAPANPPPAASSLVIQKASFESLDGGGAADVVKLLTGLIVKNALTVVASNDALGGDPAEGHLKQLHVEYTLDGKHYMQNVAENDTLTIPDPKATLVTDAPKGAAATPPAAAGALNIQKATYESLDGGGSADVVKILTGLIVKNALTVVVSNDTLGGDPAENHVKRVHIEYTLGDKKFVQDVNEGDTLTIPDPKATPKP